MTSIIESVWFYVIANFGDLNTLGTIAPGISAEVITTITIGLIVQHFFAMRVWLSTPPDFDQPGRVELKDLG
ncbi:hypothetical protein CERSUDRAFT_100607 [Gelatoporia subvermispora B]|uniref:Uncharacterized protein n=1 Tax=Ceriporiopsis subvermispora (strain B) TaxID=914234 RepID=M2Q388_CERS8|nr:hypothetical protein CERSUDRAFT_100607 [Gelatoporia subvermispora B]